MLYKHQEQFAKRLKNKMLIVWEGGVGKTIAGCIWLKDNRDSDALVVCPKRIRDKWSETLSKFGTKATVVSKEQFKKLSLLEYSAIIVDEADEFASPLFTKNRSQLSTALYELVKMYPKMPVLLATATPIRSNPWNLHTLLCYLNVYFDKNAWRSQYFNLERRPFLRQMAWFPKSDWRKKMRPLLEKYADIVLLKDCVADLPPITERTVPVPSGKFVAPLEVQPTAIFVAEHKHEQKNKIKSILEIGKEYRKVLVVAHYVEQVESLAKELSKDRETFMVHGSVKNQEQVLNEANNSDECFLVCQASLGVGFDADSFSCVIFASMSYKVRDYMQMRYRVRRVHNLHPVEYVYLLGGRCDKAVKKTIDLGMDFVPSQWQ